MIRLKFEKRLEYGARFVVLIQDGIEAREIQVGLVEVGSGGDAGLKLLFGGFVFAVANEEDAEIVKCVGVIGAEGCGFL